MSSNDNTMYAVSTFISREIQAEFTDSAFRTQTVLHAPDTPSDVSVWPQLSVPAVAVPSVHIISQSADLQLLPQISNIQDVSVNCRPTGLIATITLSIRRTHKQQNIFMTLKHTVYNNFKTFLTQHFANFCYLMSVYA